MSKKINRFFTIDESFNDNKIYVIVYHWNDKMSCETSRIFIGSKLKEDIKKLSFMSTFKIGEVDNYGDIGQFKYFNKRDNDIIVLNKKNNYYLTFDIDQSCYHFYKPYTSMTSLIDMLKGLIEIKNTKDYIGFKDVNHYGVEGCRMIDEFPTEKEWFNGTFNDFEKLNIFLNEHKDIFNDDCFKELENLKERINKAYNSFE